MAAYPSAVHVLAAAVLYLGSIGYAGCTSGDPEASGNGSFVTPNNDDEKPDNNESLSIGLGSGIPILVIVITVGVILAIFALVKYTKYKTKRVKKKTNKIIDDQVNETVDNEVIERENARLATNYYLELASQRPKETTGRTNRVDYYLDEALYNLGSRMQKYWYSASPREVAGKQQAVVTNCPLPRLCAFFKEEKGTGKRMIDKETVSSLNGFMASLREHPFIHPIEEIGYLDDRKQVIIIQPFMKGGSLKDMIYGVSNPKIEWADKYPDVGRIAQVEFKIDAKDVAKYGWQILKAMVFLYKKGFPVLGHVQSGNIFVQDGVCRLGGYENTLLGYRSRFYRMCEEHLEHMDVIMFGHLVFEMSCAYELTTLAPTEQDYQAVRARNDGGREIEEVLKYIFAEGFAHSIKDIKKQGFFQSAKPEKKFKMSEVQKFQVKQFFSGLLPGASDAAAREQMLAAVRDCQDDGANEHARPKEKRPRAKPTSVPPDMIGSIN